MSEQTTSKKWAAVVVDANEGKILYEKHADQQRHPASLTKMMTLYLLFDSLNRKKIGMNSSMTASKKAASQPQTNLSLKPGDRINVKQAIQALVVRSANDVAMVVAEHLGGSEQSFAKKMNQKARELGMTKTRFYNPHGLPNDNQVTSAVDMAKLSIALKRDFPQYYHYFKTASFTFNGKTYKSHNRVLGRYPGADGLKTGYIRASGFNLATSLKRGSTQLVGVIMGGTTSASRDQEMINMLDRTLIALTQQKERERNAPTKVAAATQTSTSKPIASLPVVPKQTQPSIETTAPYLSGKNWAVQVGAFPTVEQAHRAAAAAKEIAPVPLLDATLHITQVSKNNRIFNRARMLYLTPEEARDTCAALTNAHKQCITVRMGN